MTGIAGNGGDGGTGVPGSLPERPLDRADGLRRAGEQGLLFDDEPLLSLTEERLDEVFRPQ